MIKILGADGCSYCKLATELLQSKGIDYEYLDARSSEQEDLVAQLKSEGIRTIPQVWQSGTRIGGYTELAALVKDL